MSKTSKTQRGRPDKYKSKYSRMMVDFFNVEAYTMVPTTTEEYYPNGALKKVRTITTQKRNTLPTFSNFAYKIGVGKDTLIQWSKKYPEFRRAYTRAKEFQKDFLINMGLNKSTSPAMAIFLTSNLTDMKNYKK